VTGLSPPRARMTVNTGITPASRGAGLLRDYQDCAESYPGAIWPVQAQRALRGMIHCLARRLNAYLERERTPTKRSPLCSDRCLN
jgi:hypothetical protein